MKDIKPIIHKVLTDLNMHSKEACDLVYRTGMAESGYRALAQVGGPAISYFQLEPNTINDVIENYLNFRQSLLHKLTNMGLDLNNPNWSVMTNIAVAVAFARLKYRRDKEPIPKDLQGQAKYWKRVYNSNLGKGTVEHFIKANT